MILSLKNENSKNLVNKKIKLFLIRKSLHALLNSKEKNIKFKNKKFKIQMKIGNIRKNRILET